MKTMEISFSAMSLFCWRRWYFLGLCDPVPVTIHGCSICRSPCRKQMSHCSGPFEESLIRRGQRQNSQEDSKSTWGLAWYSRMECCSYLGRWGGNWLPEPGDRCCVKRATWQESGLRQKPGHSEAAGWELGESTPQPHSGPSCPSPVDAPHWLKQIGSHRWTQVGLPKLKEGRAIDLGRMEDTHHTSMSPGLDFCISHRCNFLKGYCWNSSATPWYQRA